MSQKVLIIIFGIMIIVLVGTTIYFANANSQLKKQIVALSGDNNKCQDKQKELSKNLEDIKEQLKLCTINISQMRESKESETMDDLQDSRSKSSVDKIKSIIASAAPFGYICEDDGRVMQSGNGGDKICDRSETWPVISYCGPNNSDTKWIVRNGSNENWSIVLDCKEMIDCNGPQNAICNTEGCKFAGSCK